MNKNIKGFSLIEVIVVITIIGVIGVITSTILSRSYTAGSSATTISKLRSNGEMAISEITNEIRSADAVVCYGGTTSKTQIAIRTTLGKYMKFKFVPAVSSLDGRVTKNGYIGRQVNLDPDNIANFCNDTVTTPAVTAITNTDLGSGVNITGGSFTKLTNAVSKDTVLIKFDVTDSLTLPRASGAGGAELVHMETTAQVR